MDRRIGATVIWGLAAIVFSVMTAIVSPPLHGTPVRAQPPQPPAVGACGKLLDTGLTVVPCSAAHTVEVAHTVGAGDPSMTYRFCAERARKYVGSPASGDDDAYPEGEWSLPLRYSPRLAAGPGTGGYPGWSWLACLVGPIGPAPWTGYLGSVRHLDGPSRPVALRPCFTRSDENLAVVPCTEPHRGEIVGVQVVTTKPPPDTADGELSGGGFGDSGGGFLDAGLAGGLGAGEPADDVAVQADIARRATSCRLEAAAFTGASDPTYDGQLRVLVLPGPGSPLRGPLSADTGAYYGSDVTRTWLLCTIEAPAETSLIGSIAQWGDRPLPLG